MREEKMLKRWEESQLLDKDHEYLFQICQLQKNEYNYLEIGSYLGGSLFFHLQNELCKRVASIDLRIIANDERHMQISTKNQSRMIDLLKSRAIPTEKLYTFQIDVADFSDENKYDICFIDAEHTNQAVFRDSINCSRHMNENCVMIYHDVTLVYGAIDCLIAYYQINNIPHRFYKLRESELAVVVIGKCDNTVEDYFISNNSDYDKFKMGAKIRLANDVKKNNPSYVLKR